MMGYANPMIVCDAADFDGTNDFMARGAGLSGAADSKTGILSAWFRIDGGDGTSIYPFNCTGDRVLLVRGNDNNFVLQCLNTAGSVILDLRTTGGAFVAGSTWRHFLCSWDLATAGASNLYMNDVSNKSISVFTNDTIDYTVADWWIGILTGSFFKWNGAMADFYFAPGQYLDFALVSNRRKYISASGKPVHLGTTGALPTGTAPLVYQHLADGEAVANFATNRGTGGNFTITGTLDTASTSPSD